MKKLSLLLVCLCLIGMTSASVLGLTTCSEVTNYRNTTHSNVVYGTLTPITFGGDEKYGSILNITPTTDYYKTLCQNFTLKNGTYNTVWIPFDEASTLNFTNASGDVIPALGNFSFNIATGYFYTNFSDAVALTWNNTNATACYVKHFLSGDGRSNIQSFGGVKSTTPGTDWGSTAYWQILTQTWEKKSDTEYGINNTSWNSLTSYTTRTCSARDSCQQTKLVIFAGLSLLAVALIALGAFGIIQIVNGSAGAGALTALVISLIGLVVIIMVGYVVIGSVGSTICLAAVG